MIDAPARLQQVLERLGQPALTDTQAQALAVHFTLLLRWNVRMNLTAIRDGESILRRHFVESILCARLLPSGIETLLDYGSGGGFPGIPIAICRPEVRVTLAESQGKKASFLREVVRTLRLDMRVFQGRVESMAAPARFDVVSLRAVDRMTEACHDAATRVKPDGWMAVLSTKNHRDELREQLTDLAWADPILLKGSDRAILLLGKKPQ